MKYYLAATYEHNPEMREYRDVLAAKGHVVTSRWIDLHDGVAKEAATETALNGRPGDYTDFAIHDIQDIERADVLILFTEGSTRRGGKHTEFGYALGRGKDIILIGPLLNVFHTLPEVMHYTTWDLFQKELG